MTCSGRSHPPCPYYWNGDESPSPPWCYDPSRSNSQDYGYLLLRLYVGTTYRICFLSDDVYSNSNLILTTITVK
jgi:hypothetical protein